MNHRELSPLVKRDPVTGEPLRKANGTYKYHRNPTGICDCGKPGKRRPTTEIICDDCYRVDVTDRVRHLSVPPKRRPGHYVGMTEYVCHLGS